MLNIDGDQISIGIDLDQGARLASVQWRDMQFAVPFAGDPRGWGWYAMAPWAGRIKNGIVKDKSGKEIQLQTTFDHHMQFMVMASSPLGKILDMAGNYLSFHLHTTVLPLHNTLKY